jgi:predicted kinase
LRLTLDEWMAVLFRPDRPETGLPEWYVERAGRCVEQIWALTQALIASGKGVVLEIGLLQRAARERFYRRVEAAGFGLSIYALDAPREQRRARVQARNAQGGPTFSQLVPPEIFELASDLWEPLAPEEGEGRELSFIDTSER